MDLYVAVFDIETANRIDQMAGRFRDDKIKNLTISCASVLTLPSEFCRNPRDAERAMELSTMKTYWVDGEGPESLGAMVQVLKNAELVVGYNLAGFDWLVMEKYISDRSVFRRCCTRTHDIFSRVRDACPTQRWPKLDTLLSLNGLESKSGDGLQAIVWWLNGQRELLREYCEADVRLCAQLALLDTLAVEPEGEPLQNYIFGIASALAAMRFSEELLVSVE